MVDVVRYHIRYSIFCQSANLQKTRVGVVLVGAALMDDVVGLVIVNIVTALGSGETGECVIARPIVSSFGLLLVVQYFMAFVLRPIRAWPVASLYGNQRSSTSQTSLMGHIRKTSANLSQHIPNFNSLLFALALIALVAIASVIDSSLLLAAFIAGGMINYIWDATNSIESASGKAP